MKRLQPPQPLPVPRGQQVKVGTKEIRQKYGGKGNASWTVYQLFDGKLISRRARLDWASIRPTLSDGVCYKKLDGSIYEADYPDIP